MGAVSGGSEPAAGRRAGGRSRRTLAGPLGASGREGGGRGIGRRAGGCRNAGKMQGRQHLEHTVAQRGWRGRGGVSVGLGGHETVLSISAASLSEYLWPGALPGAALPKT